MLIRGYKSTDRAACIVVFKSNMPAFFAPEELSEFEYWLEQQEIIGTPKTDSTYYYVVENENAIIACAGFHLDFLQAHATLAWGMVDSSWHRKGIGKKLLAFRLATIKALQPNATIALDTSQHSYPFFEAMGFTLTKITKDFYAKGLDRYDMIY